MTLQGQVTMLWILITVREDRKEIYNSILSKYSTPLTLPVPCLLFFFPVALVPISHTTYFVILLKECLKIYLPYSLLNFQYPKQSLAHGRQSKNISESMFTQQLIFFNHLSKNHTHTSLYITRVYNSTSRFQNIFTY